MVKISDKLLKTSYSFTKQNIFIYLYIIYNTIQVIDLTNIHQILLYMLHIVMFMFANIKQLFKQILYFINGFV